MYIIVEYKIDASILPTTQSKVMKITHKVTEKQLMKEVWQGELSMEKS